MAALKRGEQACCFQFEESRETFLRRSEGYGMDFKPFLESGRLKFVQVTIADLSPGEFAARVRRSVEEERVALVVLDSLNGYLNGMPSERFLLIHMHELLSYLGCPAWNVGYFDADARRCQLPCRYRYSLAFL
jgi:circadian clock protein KaiC